MISSARCIQARASIVSCPTVRMPVPTITSAPALLASSVMPHPTGGNTAAAPLIAAVDTRRTAAETPAGESARLWGLGTRSGMGGLGARSGGAGGGGGGGDQGLAGGAEDSVRYGRAGDSVRYGRARESPLAGRRPSPRHRSLGRSYLLPKGS